MRTMAKVLLTVCIVFACTCAATLAYADWSNAWKHKHLPDIYTGKVTEVEFFIMPGAPAGVTFDALTSIWPSKSYKGWTSELPNHEYSLLFGSRAKFFSPASYLTTYFSGPKKDKFSLDLVLWNGGKVVEREEFKWLGNQWSSNVKLLPNNPGNYDRTPDAVPIPPTILLLAPGGLGVLLLRRRIQRIAS